MSTYLHSQVPYDNRQSIIYIRLRILLKRDPAILTILQFAELHRNSKGDLLRCEGAYRQPKRGKSTLVHIRITDANFIITPEA
jgi:hypothetical protein